MPTYPFQVPTGTSIIPFGSGNQNLGSTTNYLGNIYVNKVIQTGTTGGGGVSGPASTTSSGIAIWNGTGGTTLADSEWTITGGNLLPTVSGTQNIGSVALPVGFVGITGTINGCRQVAAAWCSWDQANGTPTISGNFNVASLTDGGAGLTTVNFTNAMKNITYAACGNTGSGSTMSPILLMTTGCKVTTINASETKSDMKFNNISIFAIP